MTTGSAGCSRRSVLRGLAGAGVVLVPGVLVAGCGREDAGSAAAALSGTVPVSEVPVGQARVVALQGGRAVVAQPTKGEYAAFPAVCTHQGGALSEEEGLVVLCTLHGSRFDAGDGAAVVNGPATEPLSTVPVAVEGDQLVLG